LRMTGGGELRRKRRWLIRGREREGERGGKKKERREEKGRRRRKEGSQGKV